MICENVIKDYKRISFRVSQKIFNQVTYQNIVRIQSQFDSLKKFIWLHSNAKFFSFSNKHSKRLFIEDIFANITNSSNALVITTIKHRMLNWCSSISPKSQIKKKIHVRSSARHEILMFLFHFVKKNKKIF